MDKPKKYRVWADGRAYETDIQPTVLDGKLIAFQIVNEFGVFNYLLNGNWALQETMERFEHKPKED